MGVVVLDPTLLVDELTDPAGEDYAPALKDSGIMDMDKIAVYRCIFDSLEDDRYKYGHVADSVSIYMSTEDVAQYLECLADNLVTALSESDLGGGPSTIEEQDAGIQDEWEAFNRYSATGTPGPDEDEGDVELSVLVNALLRAFEASIVVCTGDHKEIKSNIILI